MATRARRDRLEVHRDTPPRVVPGSSSAAPATGLPSSPAAPAPVPENPPTDTGGGPDEWVEPDLYGVRTSWQSEAVRIEAAEFLVATRVQESSRRRLAGLTQRLREQSRDEGQGA